MRWWPFLLGIVTTSTLFLQTRTAGIWNDDIFNLQQHRVEGPLPDLLLHPVFATQVAPGHRMLTELQLQLGPTDGVILHLFLAVLMGGCVVLGSNVAARLRGHTWWVPLVLAVVLAGPAGLTTSLWYAAAFHIIPALTAGLSAVLLYLRWRGDAPTGLPQGWPRASVIALLVGMLFSLKALLAVLFLVLLEYVLLRRGDLETVIMGVWRDRTVWGPYGLLAVIYWFVTQRAGIDPTIGEAVALVEAVGRGMAGMSIPMLFGLASTQAHYIPDPLPTTVLLGSWALAAALALHWTRQSTLASRSLVVAATVVAAGLAVSAASRTPMFGVEAALTPRYHLEGLVYAVLALAVGLRDVERPLVGRRLSSVPSIRRTVHALAALALVVAVVWSDGARRGVSLTIESGEWVAGLERSLAVGESAPQVVDAPLPDFVITLFPGRRLIDLDGLVPGLDIDPRSADSVVTEDGTVEPLVMTPLFEQTGREFSTNGLVAVAGEHTVVSDSLCTPTSMTAQIALGRHPAPRLIALSLAGDASVRLDYEPRAGFHGEPPVEAVITDGADRLLLPLDQRGWVERVRLTVETTVDEQACIDLVRILEVHNDLPGSNDFPT